MGTTIVRRGAPELRKFPYPYKAGMTITNDIDACSPEEFLEIHQFLNTSEDTAKNVFGRDGAGMGRGVGLELGDSFWMATDKDVPWIFSYYKPNSIEPGPQADLIRTYAHAGYLDAMHSYGDMAGPESFTRKTAEAALAEMNRMQIAPAVFTDHGGAENTNNIGRHWRGDDPFSAQHHSDLTMRPNGPFAFVADARYTWMIGSQPLEAVTLRDGVRAYAFQRYWNAMEGWNVDRLQNQLTPSHLDRLVESESYWVVVNHFGMARSGYDQIPVFKPPQQQALRELARRSRSGEIWLTTSAKLLQYAYARDRLVFNSSKDDWGIETIDISQIKDPVYGDHVPSLAELQGIAFYVENPGMTRISVGGFDATDKMQTHPPDDAGRRSVGFPLQHLPPLPEWTSDGATRKTEDYREEEYDYAFSVTNLDSRRTTPTLHYVGLHPFQLADARVGSTYFIDAPDDKHIRLSRLEPGGTIDRVQVRNGPYNPAIPRLIGKSRDGVESALFDARTGRIGLTLTGDDPLTMTFAQAHRPIAGTHSKLYADGRMEVAAPGGEAALESVPLQTVPSAGAIAMAIGDWRPSSSRRDWSESLDAAMTVTHVVEGLKPGVRYIASLDGAEIARARASAAGALEFHFQAGAGEHRLSLSESGD